MSVNRKWVKILFTTMGNFVLELRTSGQITGDSKYYLVDKIICFDDDPGVLGKAFLPRTFRPGHSEPLEIKGHAVLAEKHAEEDVVDAYERKVIEFLTFGAEVEEDGDISIEI